MDGRIWAVSARHVCAWGAGRGTDVLLASQTACSMAGGVADFTADLMPWPPGFPQRASGEGEPDVKCLLNSSTRHFLTLSKRASCPVTDDG